MTYRAWAHLADVEHTVTNSPHLAAAEKVSTAGADALDNEAKPHFAAFRAWRIAGIGMIWLSILALVFAAVVGAESVPFDYR